MNDGWATDQAATGRLKDWLGFIAMAVGMFLAILDIQIVASSLIDIQIDLHIPANRLSYIQTTYLIAEVIAIAISGWLTRATSTRWLYAIGLAGFVLASAACAASESYPVLYTFRFIQGLFGGVLIPAVFSAAFLMFPPQRQALATGIAGSCAMLAPTIGPFIGGWITENLSWHWLFLINIAPGLIAVGAVARWVQIDLPDWARLRRIDLITLGLAVTFLATLELTLKESPRLGWSSTGALALAVVCAVSGYNLVRRSLRATQPLIELDIFRDRDFAIGAWFSFMLGMALFGATYLLPLYLGVVRDHGPLEIGTIMMVTGATQLLTAPFATVLERRYAPRGLTFLGYGLFAAGLFINARSTPTWDFQALVPPQVLRGAGLLLCLLPTTRLALGRLPPERVAQASALFNLMRNIGGAVGLAMIDTIIENRPAQHVAAIVARLQAGDRATAAFVGLPLDRFTGKPIGPIDETTRQMLEPLVQHAAATASFNEAWLVLGILVTASLVALPFISRSGDSPA
ncbi:MAG: DHA2 family efflux MFS transporter permease subunit [Rhodospirillaceae bacterium]|nr:MAG: DHA2 family efflux MFS transporter permease subunit [Rhodospirillaceae bacterium]